MSFTALTKKAVGDAIDKTFLDGLVDNDIDLNSRLAALEVEGVPNGSFEYDADSDGLPDKWVRTTTGAATGSLETTTYKHGRKAVKGVLTSATGDEVGWWTEDYVPCAPGQRLDIRALLKASVGSLYARIDVVWYYWNGSDYASASTSSTAVWTTSSAATSWKRVGGQVVVPGGANEARYYRVKVSLGGASNATAGTLYLDNVEARVYHGPVWLNRVDITTNGTITLTQAGDETPVAAHLLVAMSGYGDVPLQVTGNGKTVVNNVILGSDTDENARYHVAQYTVELNESLQFSVTWSGDYVSGAVLLLGYEV